MQNKSVKNCTGETFHIMKSSIDSLWNGFSVYQSTKRSNNADTAIIRQFIITAANNNNNTHNSTGDHIKYCRVQHTEKLN